MNEERDSRKVGYMPFVLEMFGEKELLVFLVFIMIHHSVAQLTSIVPIKYERVYVEANSFSTSTIKTTNGGLQRYIDAYVLDH